jgi:hypothetical protein
MEKHLKTDPYVQINPTYDETLANGCSPFSREVWVEKIKRGYARG